MGVKSSFKNENCPLPPNTQHEQQQKCPLLFFLVLLVIVSSFEVSLTPRGVTVGQASTSSQRQPRTPASD